MADVLMVATIVGFVLLCTAYIAWCDRIVEHDHDAHDHEQVAA